MSEKSSTLRRFREALSKYKNVLNSATYWRYRNGELPPPLGELLLGDPALAQALADDIAELHAARLLKPEAAHV